MQSRQKLYIENQQQSLDQSNCVFGNKGQKGKISKKIPPPPLNIQVIERNQSSMPIVDESEKSKAKKLKKPRPLSLQLDSQIMFSQQIKVINDQSQQIKQKECLNLAGNRAQDDSPYIPNHNEEEEIHQQLQQEPISINQINQHNGQPHQHSQETQTQVCPLVCSIIILLILIGVSGLLLYLHRCAFLDQDCSVVVMQPALIVNRKFQSSQCFVVNYTKFTETLNGENSTLQRTNLTNYYCVKNITASGDINGVGYLKKISEQALQANQSEPTHVQYFDTEIALQSPLLMQVTNNTDHSSQNSDFTDSNMSGDNMTLNTSELQNATNNMVMYLFTIFRNGTLNQLTFDSRNDNMTTGDLPKLIKMFFPQLTMSLYISETRRMLQDANTNTTTNNNTSSPNSTASDNSTAPNNSTSPDNSTTPDNNKVTNYDYKALQSGDTQLTNSVTQIPTINDGLYSSQQVDSQSNFDSSGDISSSQLSGTGDVNSVQTSPQEAHVTHNLNISLSIRHNVSMRVVATMLNLTVNNILSFEAYFQSKVVVQNQSLTMTEAELIAYMSNPGDGPNATTRLLQTLLKDQIKLFSDSKQISLLKTNIVGFPLKITGYSLIYLGLKTLDKYQYKPRFISSAGLLLQLGPFSYNHKIFEAEKDFDPISLGFTLDKVNQLIDLLKGGFLKQLFQVSKLAASGTFDISLAQKMLGIFSTLSSAVRQIDAVRQGIIPSSQISDLLSGVSDFFNTFNDYFSKLNQINSVKLQNITNSIFQYTNSSFTDCLKQFQKIQTQFSAFNGNFNSLLDIMVNQSNPILSKSSSFIKHFLTDQLTTIYNGQLKKAQAFFDYYAYIRNIVTALNSNFTQQIDIFEDGFNQTLSYFLGNFYLQPMKDIRKLTTYAQQKKAELNDYMDQGRMGLLSAVERGDSKLQKALQNITTIYNLISSSQVGQIQNEVNTLIADLNNLMQIVIDNVWRRCGSINAPVWYWVCSRYPQEWKDNAENLNSFKSELLQLQINLTDFAKIASKISNYTQQVTSSFSSNKTIGDKYDSIQKLKPPIFENYTDQVTNIIAGYDDLSGRIKHFLDIFHSQNTCWYLCLRADCCEQWQMYTAHDALRSINNKFETFRPLYFSSLLTIITIYNNYIQLIDTFNVPNYKDIINFASITQNSLQFQKQLNQSVQKVVLELQKVLALKDTIKHNFMMGLSIKQTIAASFEGFQSMLDTFCLANDTKKILITQIRQKYQSNLGQVKILIDSNLLNSSFSQLKDTLLNMSNNFLENYHPLAYCSPQMSEIISNLSLYINDTMNFALIQKYASVFWTQINQTANYVRYFQSIINNQDQLLYLLFDYNQFTSFMYNCSLLVNSSKQQAKDLGLNVFQLKKMFPFLQQFSTVNSSLTYLALQPFNNTNYLINYFTLFSNFSKKLSAAQSILKDLNFEVLQVFIAIKKQVDLVLDWKDLVISQSNLIVQDFGNLIQSFQSLTSGVNQQSLNNLQQSFLQLQDRIVNSFIQPILQNYNDFNEYFNHLIDTVKTNTSLGFKTKVLEGMLVNATKQFINCSSQITTLLSNYSKNVTAVIDQAYKLIKLIKIGFLNQLNLIGEDYSGLLDKFVQTFTSKLFSVKNLKENIIKDFFFALGSNSFLQNILLQVQKVYNQTLLEMQTVTLKHLKIIEQDSVFADSFLNTSTAASIRSFSSSLAVDFTSLNNQIKGFLDLMKNVQSKLTANITQDLAQLYFLKGNLTAVQSSMHTKFGNIKASFEDIEECFTNLFHLIFLIVENDLNTTIIINLKSISTNLTSMLKIDIPKIARLLSSMLPNKFDSIRTILSQVVNLCNLASDTITIVEGELVKDINMVTTFIQTQLVGKFSRLKQAQSLLHTLTQAMKPQGKVVLYRKQLDKQVIPIFQLRFLAFTPIGAFSLAIRLNFYYSCAIVISLVNTRNLDFGIQFYTNLNLAMKFGYGLPGIFQCGVYFQGQLLSVKTEPGFGLDKVIPYQVVEMIAPLKEFKRENFFQLVFYTDLEVYALRFNVGGYVSFWWFKFIWLRIHFCIRIRQVFIRIRFCISFRIPFIIPYWKTKYFGTTVNGIAIVKKRVLESQIFHFQY